MGILETIPHRITGPAAWVGSEMRDAPDLWLYTLSADEIDALDTAAAQYLAQNRDIADITAASFPLGAMAPVVDQLSKTLLRRHGFMVLRGLPIKRYDQRTAAAIFCGIGAHLGSARSQNAAGHILGHVRNVGADPTNPNARIYQTAVRQSFHTDSADIVALLWR